MSRTGSNWCWFASVCASIGVDVCPPPRPPPLRCVSAFRRVGFSRGFSPGVTGSRAAPCCASHTFLPALARTSFSQLCWRRSWTGPGCPRQCVGSLGQSWRSTGAHSCAWGWGCVVGCRAGSGCSERGGTFLLAVFRNGGPAAQAPLLCQFVLFSSSGPAVFGGVFGFMDSFSVCVCVSSIHCLVR